VGGGGYIFFAVRHKLGQKAGESPTIRQESTVCYSEILLLFVRLDAVQLKKYIPCRPQLLF